MYPLLEKSVFCEEPNLFKFLLNSLSLVKEYLEIQKPLIVSSTIPVDHSLRAESRVLAICKARGASAYLNPIGGLTLYQEGDFQSAGIDLAFLKTDDIRYKQFNDNFVPALSIIDVMMFNEKDVIREYLESGYTLVKNDVVNSGDGLGTATTARDATMQGTKW